MQFKSLYIILSSLIVVDSLQAQFSEKTFDQAVAIQERNRTLYGYNRFKNKSFAVKDSFVRFFLRNNTAARQGALCGSFSNWSPLPMTKTDSGWIVFTKLAHGKHLYKFVVDGKWIIDDDNLSTETDDNRYTNSVYYKPNVVFTIDGFHKAKTAWLCASFNDHKKDELPLIKTSSGWQIALYLADGTYSYKFWIDNEWHDDPKNIQKLTNKAGRVTSVLTIGEPAAIRDLAYYKNELAVQEESGDEAKIAQALSNTARRYYKTNDYTKAIQTFQQAKSLFEKLNDRAGVADMLMGIANAYLRQSDIPPFREYLQKATTEYEKSK